MKTLAQSVAALAASFLLGCDVEAPYVAGPSSRPAELHILGWGNYVSPEVLAQFEKETGIKPVYTPYDNPDDMLGRMRAFPHQFDLVITGSVDLPELERLQVLQPLKHGLLSGLERLDSRLTVLANDRESHYCIPYLWGTFGIGYCADKVAPPAEESLQFIFDQVHQGEVLLVDNLKEIVMLINAYQGRAVDDFQEQSIADAEKLLTRVMSEQNVSFRTDQEVMRALKEGTCSLALTYSGDLAWAASQNPSVKYFCPKEGAPVWVDVLVMSREAPNPGAAYAFLNLLLRPEVMALNSDYTFYPNCNKDAMALVDPGLLDNRFLVPLGALEKAKPYPHIRGLPSTELAEMNQRIRSPLR